MFAKGFFKAGFTGLSNITAGQDLFLHGLS